MGAIKSAIDDFLDNGGKELGYDEDNLPDLDDFQLILQQSVKVWEYHGKTEIEYYGGSENEQD